MEFHPVIMAAGKGSRMTDLTSQCPKALLPMGNMPLIWYPIKMLEREGFEEAIVIVLDSFSAEVQKVLLEICNVKIRLDFVSIPDNDYWGTADSLRYVKDKIKSDILVLSCDLLTDLPLHRLADVHRTYNASVTVLLSPLQEQFSEVPAPGVKSKRTERDFIGFDKNGDRILFMSSEADMENSVKFRTSVLRKHPCLTIKSNLTDCHLYLMKKWVVNFLAEYKSISSLKGELIPYIVKKQFAKPKCQEKDITHNANMSVISEDVKTDIFSFAAEDKLLVILRGMSSWMDHSGDMSDCYHGGNIRCYGFVQDFGLCVRVNTLGTYAEANKQIPRWFSLLAPDVEMNMIHTSATVKEKSQVGSDCILGEGVSVGEKVSVKHSIIGKHCTIGDKVKITNSVVMDHVTISDMCNIMGSVIGASAHISEKCELKDCIVGQSQNIIAMGKFTNEAIVDIDKMMEI
ncbi:hypothetical protein ScPMuIL_006631 [Solemya velum]